MVRTRDNSYNVGMSMRDEVVRLSLFDVDSPVVVQVVAHIGSRPLMVDERTF